MLRIEPKESPVCSPQSVFKAQSLKSEAAPCSALTSLYSWGEIGFVSPDFSACSVDGYLCAFKKKMVRKLLSYFQVVIPFRSVQGQ